MAGNDAALVPTLTTTRLLVENRLAGLPADTAERARQVVQSQIEGVRIARAAGVRIGSGADLTGPTQDVRGMELVMRSEVEDPMAALLSATSANADILGIADEVGTVEVGKRADLVVFDGNPLDDPKIFADTDRVVLVIQDVVVDRRRT